MSVRSIFLGSSLALAVIAATALCAAVGALAAAPAAQFGRDRISFHLAPTLPGGPRTNVSIIDLAPAAGSKMVAAIGTGLGEGKDVYPAPTRYFGAARFNADGSLDRSFGRRGFAPLVRPRLGAALGLVHGECKAVTLAPDDKILLAGYRYRGPHTDGRLPVLVRLLPDGSPDPGFGRNGVVTPRHEPGLGEWFSDVAVTRRGRIVAVGAVTQTLTPPAGLRRRPAALVRAFRPDGRIDRRFGQNGTQRTSDPLNNHEYTALRRVRLLLGGKLLVSGYSRNRLLLERLTATGRLDPSFGGDGIVAFGYEASGCYSVCDQSSSLIVGGEGKILVQANLEGVLETSPELVRFLPDGRVDRSFGRRGIVHDTFESLLLSAEDIAPAGNGRFVVVGYGYDRRTSQTSAVALRFSAAGERDHSFGERGFLVLRRGTESGAYALLARPDGGFVAGGLARFEEGFLQRDSPELLALRRYP